MVPRSGEGGSTFLPILSHACSLLLVKYALITGRSQGSGDGGRTLTWQDTGLLVWTTMAVAKAL